jgi:hypothetical protein
MLHMHAIPSTIVCTYIHTYIHTPPRPPVTGHDPQSASVHNVWQLRYQLGHFPALFLPTPSSRPSMAVNSASSSVSYPLLSMGDHVCMQACPDRGMNVCERLMSQYFRYFDQLCVAPASAAVLSDVGSDGYHAR